MPIPVVAVQRRQGVVSFEVLSCILKSLQQFRMVAHAGFDPPR